MRHSLGTLIARLVLAASLLFAVALWLPTDWLQSNWLKSPVESAPRPPAVGTIADQPAPGAPHLEARPLFDPERGKAKAMAEDPAAPREGFAQSYDLRGILRTETGMLALFENRATKTTERLTEGQVVDEWELTEIGDGTVTFRNGADEAVFKLQFSERPAAPATEQ